ncbi:resolvase, N-terminal domain protein [delta proteobacterium NaphS2]|nr:resolvase, N-terminal domain protein [delta proteobacterium NaphS2]
MKTIAYLRVSTDKQELNNQKIEILEYARKRDLKIDDFMELQISSRKTTKDRQIDSLLETLREGDVLIVSELSRLGRSLGQIIQIVDSLIRQKVKFIAVKQNMVINGKSDIQTKVMVTMFGLFAEIERDLISERTKAGLAAARAKGRLLGRPKGTLGKSKMDGKEEEIKDLLAKGVNKTAISKILGVSRTALHSFIRSRGLG